MSKCCKDETNMICWSNMPSFVLFCKKKWFMVLPMSSCVVQLICFVYFYMWKNYILIFFFDISPMGTPKLNLKPKQHNSKILHCLAGLHFFEVTICRYRVHTVKRYVFLLSSPPTQIHRNTFLELAFKSPSSLPSSANNAAGTSSNTWGDALLLLLALLDFIQLLYWRVIEPTTHLQVVGAFKMGREVEWVEDKMPVHRKVGLKQNAAPAMDVTGWWKRSWSLADASSLKQLGLF